MRVPAERHPVFCEVAIYIPIWQHVRGRDHRDGAAYLASAAQLLHFQTEAAQANATARLKELDAASEQHAKQLKAAEAEKQRHVQDTARLAQEQVLRMDALQQCYDIAFAERKKLDSQTMAYCIKLEEQVVAQKRHASVPCMFQNPHSWAWQEILNGTLCQCVSWTSQLAISLMTTHNRERSN